jgi:hypothetical protein
VESVRRPTLAPPPDAIVNGNATPRLLRLIEGGALDPTGFATHRLSLADGEAADDVFVAAAEAQAVKVVAQAVPSGTQHSAPQQHHQPPKGAS